MLISLSTQTKEELISKYNITHKEWWHRTDNSNNLKEDEFNRFITDIRFDFVLHDGAHDYETVKHDLSLILPYMKFNSILLVHDTLHEKCGKDVLRALDSECSYETESMILPYGYGLAIIRIKSLTLKEKNGSVQITKEKAGSKYKTAIL